ncbi:hypothetical protein [Pantoea ananatis]|uniref:hypothetical protein n=1 Tax=Pantoea ananas TaxID=553 RepID=UPI001B3018F5|nr:hypothetical protein [Pantoea ananatis]
MTETMQTELNKLIDTCTQAFTAWIPHDLGGATSGVIVAAFWLAGVYMIGYALMPARKSA